jgi:replicative DNA helicase
MTPEKQKLLIEYLISSPDVFTITSNIIQPKYFDAEFRNTIHFIVTYYNNFRALPDIQQIHAETDLSLSTHQLTRDKVDYCIIEVESFCKNKAIECAILDSPDLLRKGDFGGIEKIIKDAVTTSIHRSLGLSLFEDYEVVFSDQDFQPAMSTGYENLDNHLHSIAGKGFCKGELIIVAGAPGTGKSLFLSNFAINYMAQGLNVLYISLELSCEMVLSRITGIITDIPQTELRARHNEARIKLKQKRETMGDLQISQLPAGSDVNSIRALLVELETKQGFIPDVIVVDYMDLMGSTERISADNIFQKDKSVSEALRNLGSKNSTDLISGASGGINCLMLTASQLNRSSVDKEVMNFANIAGGMSKANTADYMFAIITSDVMKQQGEIALQLLKTRSSDGVGSIVPLRVNRKTLRITSGGDKQHAAPVFAVTNDELKAAQNEKRSKLLDQFKDL